MGCRRKLTFQQKIRAFWTEYSDIMVVAALIALAWGLLWLDHTSQH